MYIHIWITHLIISGFPTTTPHFLGDDRNVGLQRPRNAALVLWHGAQQWALDLQLFRGTWNLREKPWNMCMVVPKKLSVQLVQISTISRLG